MSQLIRKLPLRFGIASLDRLIDPDQAGSESKHSIAAKATWTAAIVGPDGCGKSILALHLASTYWHDLALTYGQETDQNPPRVIYVSTDLSHEQASTQWKGFGLDFPSWRELAVSAAYENCDRTSKHFEPENTQLKLKQLQPTMGKNSDNRDALASLLSSQSSERCVYFFDLHSHTAGDDWGFINHLVGLLPKAKKTNSNDVSNRHLLIVDAVEGLETFVGDKDSFGQARDRRSRVAQLIRRAMAIGVHLVFVVEEPHPNARLPEQFVSDLVVRLRHNDDGQYTQRTVEIEKCRAIAHVRGQHEFSIRHGRGSSTGSVANLDDPKIRWRSSNGDLLFENGASPADNQSKVRVDRQRPLTEEEQLLDDQVLNQCLAHINVVPSIYSQNRAIREDRSQFADLCGQPTFDLQAIQRLFPVQPDTKSFNATASKSLGSISVLVGETGTFKGRLSRRYLAQAFRNPSAESEGVAVLLSTRFIDYHSLTAKIKRHLDNLGPIEDRVLCYRFGSRHLSTGMFIDIIHKYIRDAQKKVFGKPNCRFEELNESKSAAERRKKSHLIRVVLEDWNVLLATYPNLRQEPLLLSTVLCLFRREGVSALIVSTQPGQPGIAVGLEANELRNLDESQILAWTVPFYGDRRVAITATSAGVPHRTPIICELCPQKNKDGSIDDELLDANRHFDLYADVDLGKPRRVPLIVRLYLGNHAPANIEDGKRQFIRLLEDTFSQLFPAPAGQPTVTLEPFAEYERLLTFATVLDNSHLDHTIVFQVDEFWSERPNSMYNLTEYWRENPVAWVAHRVSQGVVQKQVYDLGTDSEEDPLGVFHPHRRCYEVRKDISGEIPNGVPEISNRQSAWDEVVAEFNGMTDSKKETMDTFKTSLTRSHFFVSESDGGPSSSYSRVNRVPYVWDFGLILADRDLWMRHADVLLENNKTIGQLWETLCRTNRPDLSRPRKLSESSINSSGTNEGTVHWEEFLTACRTIASLEDIPAFDIDLSTVETLSCWLLEMWASIQHKTGEKKIWFDKIAKKNLSAVDDRPSLCRLVNDYGSSLYQALVQLVLSCPHLRSTDRKVYRHHVSTRAVASREWYHTASAIMKRSPEIRFVPLSNCGNYSVRGDWGLAVAAGSRSEMLAHRSLDLLTSRRNNLLRLQDGIGLPVRDVLPDVHNGEIPTAMNCFNEFEKRSSQLNYRDVCRLGVEGRENCFKWLWRSQINYYDRDCLYWRRWIARMIEEQHVWFPAKVRTDRNAMDRILSGQLLLINGDPQTTLSDLNQALIKFNELRQIIQSALRDDKVS